MQTKNHGSEWDFKMNVIIDSGKYVTKTHMDIMDMLAKSLQSILFAKIRNSGEINSTIKVETIFLEKVIK